VTKSKTANKTSNRPQ